MFAKNNADQYGLAISEEDPDMREKFGSLLSDYIKAKADGRTLEEKYNEAWEEKYNEYWEQENFQNDEEGTYEVWQEQEFTDEEKEAQGIIF